MMIQVEFYKIHVNSGREGLEIIFPYNDKWYRMKWKDTPKKFKILYTARLKLDGIPIPNELKEYERKRVDIEDLMIELNLNKAEEVIETYPTY